jgi:hypothetical protein
LTNDLQCLLYLHRELSMAQGINGLQCLLYLHLGPSQKTTARVIKNGPRCLLYLHRELSRAQGINGLPCLLYLHRELSRAQGINGPRCLLYLHQGPSQKTTAKVIKNGPRCLLYLHLGPSQKTTAKVIKNGLPCLPCLQGASKLKKESELLLAAQWEALLERVRDRDCGVPREVCSALEYKNICICLVCKMFLVIDVFPLSTLETGVPYLRFS